MADTLLDIMASAYKPVESVQQPPQQDVGTFSPLRTAISGGLSGAVYALGAGSPAAALTRFAGGALLGAGASLAGQFTEHELKQIGVDDSWASIAGMAAELGVNNAIGRYATNMTAKQATELYKQEVDAQLHGQKIRDVLEKDFDVLPKYGPEGQAVVQEFNKLLKQKDLSDVARSKIIAARNRQLEGLPYSDEYKEVLSLVPEGDISSGAKLGIKSNFIFSPEGVAKKFGPVGEEVMLLERERNFVERNMKGRYASDLSKIEEKFGISPEDSEAQKAIARLLNTKAAILDDGSVGSGYAEVVKKLKRPPTQAELSAAKEERLLLKKFSDEVEQSGMHYYDGNKVIKYTPIEDGYFPHYISPKARAEKYQSKNIVDEIASTESKDKTLLDVIGDVGSEKKLSAKTARSIHQRTGIDEADIHWHAGDNLRQYFDDFSKHYAIFKTAGPNFQKYENAANLASIRMIDGKETYVPQVKQWFDKYIGELKRSNYSVTPDEAALSRNIRSLVTLTSMHTSAIPNVTQNALTMVTTGVKNFVKGLADVADKPEVMRQTGLYAARVLDNVKDDLGATGAGMLQRGARATLKYTLFDKTEIGLNRAYANMGGYHLADTILDKILTGKALPSELRSMREAGINLSNVLKDRKLAPEDYYKMALWAEKKTQFGTRMHEIPLDWHHPWAKVFTQFKSFAFNQTKFFKDMLKDLVRDYRSTGDIRAFDPLVRYGTIMPVTMVALKEFMDSIYSNDPKNDDNLIAYTAPRLGIGAAGDMLTAASYSPGALAQWAAGPAISKLSQAMYYGLKGQPDKVLETLPAFRIFNRTILGNTPEK